VVVAADGTPSKPPTHKTLYRLNQRREFTRNLCKNDQNSSLFMLINAGSSVDSIATFSGTRVHSNS
jgi:hypothetical protein